MSPHGRGSTCTDKGESKCGYRLSPEYVARAPRDLELSNAGLVGP